MVLWGLWLPRLLLLLPGRLGRSGLLLLPFLPGQSGLWRLRLLLLLWHLPGQSGLWHLLLPQLLSPLPGRSDRSVRFKQETDKFLLCQKGI